jgi:hypothetical protein
MTDEEKDEQPTPKAGEPPPKPKYCLRCGKVCEEGVDNTTGGKVWRCPDHGIMYAEPTAKSGDEAGDSAGDKDDSKKKVSQANPTPPEWSNQQQ